MNTGKQRHRNAQLAVDLYDALHHQLYFTPRTAWQGIAILLLSCDVWADDRSWKSFHDVVVFREKNDFKFTARGAPNMTMRRAEKLTRFLASELQVSRDELCGLIGEYWRNATVVGLQPHNLVGHAFRSLTVHILETFGNSEISYGEEIDPNREFPGHIFNTRSQEPRLDIVARKGNVTTAVMSTRWRFRHDRVDVVEEALAYRSAALRQNSKCRFYAVVGEFSPNRLNKILTNCPPHHPNAPLDATVHFNPALISEGLGETHSIEHLKSLEWLIAETNSW